MTRCGDPRRLPVRRVPKTRQAVLMAVVVAALFVPRAGRAVESGDGRRHAQRASHLAAGGKCRQAIAEFDKAIAVLHDPTLLFNRGECHRKLGNADAALEDYNQFLAELPNAPNRAQVEARMAELRSGRPGATVGVPSAAAAPAEVRSPGPTAAAGATTTSDPTPVHLDQAPDRGPAAVPGTPVDVAPSAPPPASPGTHLSLSAEASPRPAAASDGDALTSRPWFWIALGAVVVGAGVGAYFVLCRDPTNVPRSDLGNYRF